MSTADIVRAWRDPEFRVSLSDVPAHPAGRIELTDPSLNGNPADGDWRPNDRNTTFQSCHTHGCTSNCSIACTPACTLNVGCV